ncbi:mlo-like protein 3 [Phtheirospermum japonicum]|uniref:MLO-like protein n=1 Tax=Phtheirospermum japonicum TaxID=374723 RepID=A0A830B1P6_9LAMI|nr:mlo-like protein 3 [Phtheirospermum japonicum]
MAISEGGGGLTNRSLQDTPTWAVATVCFVFIFLGIAIEHLIHLAGHLLKKHKKAALYEATEKLKSVLMQLGFMSLILTVTQRSISKICVHNKVANYMLPCHSQTVVTKTTKHLWIPLNTPQSQFIKDLINGRQLAAATSDSTDYCGSKGVNQLNIFIFVIAAMQIVYSVVTMGLGRAKKCFFRQFFSSVAKTDYFTLRHGFIAAHLSTNSSFNFRKYIQRSLEDDFKAIVGISPIMWFMVVLFLLVDVHGWNMYLWVSFLPLAIVLFVGTKLEVIVAGMALHLTNRNTVIKGAPLVQPNDNLFWFKSTQLVLTLLHFTLFMNAFELSFFIWVTWQFGIKSCYHENVEIIAVRMVLAVMVQVICGYITLPLYALVTQMGSQYKNAILEEHTVDAIKSWHANVKQKRKIQNTGNNEDDDTSNSITPSHKRMPTLSEFASHGGGGAHHEIVQECEIELADDNRLRKDQNQKLGQNGSDD